ncbi:hypothetical protein Rsub_06626 [Raphidocelis subcapitata]|uniref:Cilia-and flagella-associated protein 96 n=1 Tax=Raphidocelis subcapitata TaxID=307507 RepID=A0A2V0P6K2_9CHLO|nr:hypothetical protein Rsub_06626 [Raphidocelis subcapitata]|eukprot:GBF93493.1 hypothetical protein Rsub_06626 [Raphidocelis subcapitata]
MTTRFGVFGETRAIGVGDPYVDTMRPDARDRGLVSIKVPVCRSGKNNDACFDKLKPLFEGEKYIDPLRRKLQQAKAGAARNVADKPFRVASPMKKSACPGDFVGTLGGKVEYKAGHVDEKKKKKGEIPGQPKNIVTSTPKKGSFGTIGTTLSERKGARGVAGEYEYMADPVHFAVRVKDGEKSPHAPFRPVGPPKRGGPGTVARHFGGRVKGAVGEFAWQPRPEPPVRSRAPGAAAAGGGGEEAGGGEAAPAAAAAASPSAPGAPFRPAAFPRSGRQATFSRFPVYEADPDEPKAAARAAARKEERERLAARAGGAFRPAGPGGKTDATRSIVRLALALGGS